MYSKMHGLSSALTHWRLTILPSSVIRMASPGFTSRTRENPRGPNALSSLATHHSSFSSSAAAFLWPSTSGRMPFGSRNANKPTWFTIVMHEYAPLTFFMVFVTASKTILSTSASG